MFSFIFWENLWRANLLTVLSDLYYPPRLRCPQRTQGFSWLNVVTNHPLLRQQDHAKSLGQWRQQPCLPVILTMGDFIIFMFQIITGTDLSPIINTYFFHNFWWNLSVIFFMILASGTITKKRTICFDVGILEKNRNNERDFFFSHSDTKGRNFYLITQSIPFLQGGLFSSLQCSTLFHTLMYKAMK